MLRGFEGEERKPESPTDFNQGYIQSEIVMIAKTRKINSMFGGDSPSPMSNNSRLDWSPGDFQTPGSMDTCVLLL